MEGDGGIADGGGRMELIRSILYVERRVTGSTRGFACALEAARAWGADLTVAGRIPGSVLVVRPEVVADGEAASGAGCGWGLAAGGGA
ncbi:MAG: hypothetical protein GWM90_21430 [Gemmatimonadetes bacterium]|nr:hypothetical protein [Gemmatimonadota bacterium]NIX46551.1 hypothetical protein [Gemmatimonadota bacterium]